MRHCFDWDKICERLISIFSIKKAKDLSQIAVEAFRTSGQAGFRILFALLKSTQVIWEFDRIRSVKNVDLLLFFYSPLVVAPVVL